MKKFYVLFATTILMTAVTGCQKESDPEVTPPVNSRKVSYIIIGTFDSQIITDGVNALNEFEESCKGGYDQALSVVNFDRATREKMNLNGTLYSLCTDGEWVAFKQSSTLEKLGEESQYLTEAINLAMEKIPADDYVLVLNSHGGGWDDTDAEDPITRSTLVVNEENTLFGKGLSLNRLLQGVRNSNLGLAGKKLKLIYFDNCLMHTAEYLSELQPVAEYSLGTTTFSYTTEQKNKTLIGNIRNHARFEEALTATCATMKSAWGAINCYAIIQAVELSKMAVIPAKVGPMVDELLAAIDADQSGEVLIAAKEVRSNTFCYNSNYNNQEYRFPLYDMGDYLFRMKAVLNSSEYDALYDQFIVAAKAALLYSQPTLAQNPNAAYGGTLAAGNENYLFSVLVSGAVLPGERSPYLNTAYSTLRMQSEGKWATLLETLNTFDSRATEYW